MRGKSHEPPLTVLADDELPVLAEPVDSDDEPVLVDVDDDEGDEDGVVVAAVVPVDDVTDVVVLLVAVDVPACVCAAATARAATAAVPATPKNVVSLPRRRSARSRSAGVTRRFGAAISAPPGAERSEGAAPEARAPSRRAGAAHRADR
jgi:hypothetical protein